MKEEELRYFENLCDKLYGQSTPQEKQSAGEELAAILKMLSKFVYTVIYCVVTY